MRKITLFISLIILISIPAFSQTVNGIPLEELNAEYIRVSANETLTKKIKLDIDYGQTYKIKNMKVMDKDGTPMQFNSMIEVLNYMSKLGYEIVNDNGSFTSFLLKKKVSKVENKQE